jgi:hypothetical protein
MPSLSPVRYWGVDDMPVGDEMNEAAGSQRVRNKDCEVSLVAM